MKITINKNTGLTIAISMIIVAIYYYLFLTISYYDHALIDTIKFILSWAGILEFIFIIFTWKKNKKNVFSFYILFMLFFFLFNYGQCFLWAFNIHTNTEIGHISLYYRLGIPSSLEIVRTQLLVLVSGLMIHIGSIYSSNHFHKKSLKKEQKQESDELLLSFCKLLFIPAVFSEFYFQFTNIINSRTYGYTGLYYNVNVQGVNVIFQIFSRLFFPVLIGLLFASNYSKRTMKLVYITFAIDVIMGIMIGDRGGWLYAAIILLICHNNYYKRFNGRQLMSLGVIGYIGSMILVAVKNIRNYGVSFNGIISSAMNSMTSPIIETISEMGGTMGITTALMMKGWNIFPYGNSFFYGLIISPSKRIISLLHLNYESVSSWFSQTYLRISNGAAFSIVGEVLINYGPYFLAVVMIVVGIIINKITDVDNLDFNNDKISIFYKIISTSVIINISRNCFSYNMGEVIYTTVLFFVLFSLYKMLRRTKSNKI